MQQTDHVTPDPVPGDTASWSIPIAERRMGFRPERAVDGMTSLVTVIRWGTTSGALLYGAILRIPGWAMLIGCVLVAHAVWRTFRPVEYRRIGRRGWTPILLELVITTGVITSTGCWDSPYLFALFTPIIAAGLTRGFWHALRVGTAGVFAVAFTAIVFDFETGIRPVTAWCGELLLTSAIAGYARRLHTQAEDARALNMSQNWRLEEANQLLVNLNRLAQDLPATFDFGETVDRAIDQARKLAPADLCAVLTLDPVSPLWNVASAVGDVLLDSYTEDRLPRIVRSIAREQLPQLLDGLGPDDPGLSPTSGSGLYVPLWAGNRQVGLLVLESNERAKFGLRHATALRSLGESIALTIDNARWFDRLRARGAAQERVRIARDLHDRVGQEIAYLAFELDRLHENADAGNSAHDELVEELGRVRSDARGIVGELRETLYDLRTDVTESDDLTHVIQTFLDRVTGRSGIHVVFDDRATRRLPLTHEREIWRIAQEAIVNAERHADATAIHVRWNVDDNGAELAVIDDGLGMRPHEMTGATTRPSYGIVGMRERAESIGGLLDMSESESGGTMIRLRLGARRETLSTTDAYRAGNRGRHV